MAIKVFKDIIAWQKAHQLVLAIYKVSEYYPKHEMFGLTAQRLDCAVSIASNIAEGFKRKTKNDSLHFYTMAQGSLEELKYQILLAKDLKYISEKDFEYLTVLAEETEDY